MFSSRCAPSSPFYSFHHRSRCLGGCSGQAGGPDFKGILPSVSYAPFEGPLASRRRQHSQREKIRADLKKLASLTAGDPALLLDRWRRTGAAIAAEFGA